jgi:aspartyl-tRNA(Asn)/glutamyl-tRNA(Gln) amidotransferase subunit A
LTAQDAALVFGVIGGFDPRDSTSSAEPMPDLTSALSGDVTGLRIGVPRAFLGDGVDAAVLAAYESALRVLTARGASIVEIELPHAGYGIPVYYLICTAEASSNLARYDGVRYGHRAKLGKDDGLRQMYERTRDEGFGPEVKRRIMLGTYVLSAGYYDAYYLKAQQVRTLLRQDYDRAFERVDVIATPTAPTPAFKLGEKTSDPVQMYLNDIFTVSANLTGLPAISVPCGYAPGRLPVGFHLTGRAFDEATLLRAADAYQRDTSFHTDAPPIA